MGLYADLMGTDTMNKGRQEMRDRLDKAKTISEQRVVEHEELLKHEAIVRLHATPWQHVKAALRSYEQDGKFATTYPTWWSPLLKAMEGDEDKTIKWAWRHVAMSALESLNAAHERAVRIVGDGR